MRKIIFDDRGIIILKEGEKYFLQFLDGQSASWWAEAEISYEDAEEAQKSADAAYWIILKYKEEKKFRCVREGEFKNYFDQQT